MAIGQLTMQKLNFYTTHFDFTTAQIVINCTLKCALLQGIDCNIKNGTHDIHAIEMLKKSYLFHLQGQHLKCSRSIKCCRRSCDFVNFVIPIKEY